jgi:hypothetical protein
MVRLRLHLRAVALPAHYHIKVPHGNIFRAGPKKSIMTPEEIRRRIIELEVEHRDLDSVIDMLTREPFHEELQLRRLKKRKLQLKDHITLLKMQLVPDIPA